MLDRLTLVPVSLLALVALLAPGPAVAAAPRDLSVQILSATTKDKVVGGAQVIFQRAGQTSITATTDDRGRATAPNSFGVDDASVTMIVKRDGYSSLVVTCPCNGLSYAISETLGQTRLDAFRVVLNWGRSPSDLDLHAAWGTSHVFWRAKEGADAFLDVDDTTSYGPETITVGKRRAGDKYVFAVHNYSAEGRYGNTDLSKKSQAKVFVYAGESLIRTYYVPANQKGALWVLFAIDGSGAVTDLDRVVDVAEIDRVGSYLKQLTERSDFGIPARTAPDVAEAAAQAVVRGEAALAAGDLEQAIALFQEAGRLDPNLARAFSNLAKAYEALGRPTEASWATRKAAELGRLPANAGLRVPNDQLKLEASTHLPNWKHYTFVPDNLIDDNLWSSWQPKRRPAGGVGEWFKITFDAPKELTGFEVFNGFRLIDDLGDLYAMNNRIKTATVEFDDGTKMPIQFDDQPRVTLILLPTPKTCRWFKVTVDSIYKGSRWNDLAVSEFHALSR